MSLRKGMHLLVCCLLILVAVAFLAESTLSSLAIAHEPNDGQGFSRTAELDGPAHSGQLLNLVSANTTDVLIVTGGSGPLTGISPIQEKDFWLGVLSVMPGVSVDWYDGVPAFALLDQYDLVIYDAGGYWYPLNDVAGVLTQYHYSGKPLIVVAPDINYDWAEHGTPVIDFCTGVLHIQGVLGIVPESTYQVYANTGHEIVFGMPSEVVMSVPALTSWPDCFEPGSSCQGVLTTGFIPGTEFGVGTCSGLPSYSPYDPAGSLFDLVAYDGYGSEGRTLTFGFPISGLLNAQAARELARNSVLYCLSTVPAIYDLQVVASPPNPSVDDVVVFDGIVTDNGGNPVSGLHVGVEDPIAQMSTLVSTGLDGHFTYSVSANRAGKFKVLFYLDGVPTECLIEVSPLNTSWANQVLYVQNPTSTRYEVTAYINDSFEGTWTIEPGDQRTLWEAPDPYGDYQLHVLTTNLENSLSSEAIINPTFEHSTPVYWTSGTLPQNPLMSDFYCQSTHYSENAVSTAYIVGYDPPNTDHTIAQVGPITIENETGAGFGSEAKPYVEAGCGAFVGVQAKCEFTCSLEASLKLGFCLGLCIPIDTPLSFAKCGFSCNVVVAEASCSASAGVKAQAGLEAGTGIGIGVESPVLLTVVDPFGQIAGYISNIDYQTDFIPGAEYSGPSTEHQTIVFHNPVLGAYDFILEGVGEGPYTLTVERSIGQEIVFTQPYSGIITEGEVLESKLSLSEANGIVTIEVTEPKPMINEFPVANAGPDQTVCATVPAMTAMVTLDGSGSYDPDAGDTAVLCA